MGFQKQAKINIRAILNRYETTLIERYTLEGAKGQAVIRAEWVILEKLLKELEV